MQGQQQLLAVYHFEWRGKTYPIAPWNLDFEAAFAAWVIDQSERRIKAQRRDDGEVEYQAKMASLRRDADKGLYEWGGEIVMTRLANRSGAKQAVLMTLQAIDPTVTPRFVEDLARDRKAWDDLWDHLTQMNFPPEPAPEGGTETPEAGTTPQPQP